MLKNLLILLLVIVVVGCLFFGLTPVIRNLFGLSEQSIFDTINSWFLAFLKVKI